jgi:hypothetical protein
MPMPTHTLVCVCVCMYISTYMHMKVNRKPLPKTTRRSTVHVCVLHFLGMYVCTCICILRHLPNEQWFYNINHHLTHTHIFVPAYIADLSIASWHLGIRTCTHTYIHTPGRSIYSIHTYTYTYIYTHRVDLSISSWLLSCTNMTHACMHTVHTYIHICLITTCTYTSLSVPPRMYVRVCVCLHACR